MYKHKHKIIFNDNSDFFLYGQDYFNKNDQLWDIHQEKLSQFCTKVSNQGFPLEIIELNTNESISINSYKSFENWLNKNQYFRYKSVQKFSDNSQNEIAFLKGLLYSAECNSNFYCSSDLNVSYEFNILNEEKENLYDLNFRKKEINNWILELHTKLHQWMFNQMPPNPSKYYGYGKNELISTIVGKIENIITDLKDVYIVEYQDFAFVDGFEMVWMADKKYALNIELND